MIKGRAAVRARVCLYAMAMSAASYAAAVPALAQETAARNEEPDEPTRQDDIVLTATRTGAATLQRVPLAVTAFSDEALETAGITELAQIATITPGFTFTTNSVWAISSIRGVGTNNVFAGGDPSVTLQVDGVYYGRPTAANVDFLDVERVEILRGPQGTLYGRNAVAGTINVITRDPGNETRGAMKFTVGKYGLIRPEAAISAPLIVDKLAISLAGRYSGRDGYIKQLNSALPDNWDEDRGSLRGKLKFTASSDLSIVLAGDYTKASENYNFATVRLTPTAPDDTTPGFFEASSDAFNASVIEQWGTSGKIVWDLSPNFAFTSLSAYRKSDSSLSGDLDFTQLPLFTTRAFVEDQEQFTQELNLNGRLGGLTFIAGLFYFHERADSFYNATVADSVFLSKAIDVRTNSYAAFLQGDYAITDRLKLTAGIRYTRDEKRSDNASGAALFTAPLPSAPRFVPPGGSLIPTFSGDRTDDAFTPKLGLNLQATDDLLVYGSVTRGFKSGGFNLLVDPGAGALASFGPERVWAYEGGVKATLRWPVRGTFNVAGFVYDYKGLQVQQFDFGGANGVLQFTNNAPAADIKGVEAELNLRPIDAVSVGGSLSYLDATYDGSFPAIDNLSGQPGDPDGQRLSDAPKWLGSAYVQLNATLGAFEASLRGEVIHKARAFSSPINDGRLGADPYWLFNVGVTLALPDDQFEIGARYENVGNERYIVGNYFSFSSGGIPGAPRHFLAYVKKSF